MDRKKDKYKTIKENLEQIRRLSKHGFTKEDICLHLELDKKLFDEFSFKPGELATILKNAAAEADLQAEEALHKRAIGYETVEESTIFIPDPEDKAESGSIKLKEIRKVKKFVPPDASSAMAWLINRKSARWSKNPAAGSELANQEIMRLKRIAAQEADENM